MQTFIAYSGMFAQVASRYRGALPPNLPRLSVNMILMGTFTNIALLLFIGIIAFAVYSRFKVRI